jgi:hypothetical protein
MIDRRTALGLFAGAAIGGSALPELARAAARSPAAFDPANQDHLALAFRKLAYSMDDRLTYWWMRGTRYGVTGSVATPFWDMYVASWFTTRDLPDGKYEVKMAGCNFYTPPGKTTLLENFANPFTGQTVAVPYAPPGVTTTLMDKRGGSPFGGMAAPGMKTTTSTDIGPAWVEGTTVHVQGDLVLRNEPLEPGKASFTVQDWSTYIGEVADVLDPARPNPPSAQMFNDILDFPRWLQMGDYKGTYVSRCYGRKVFDYGSMPATWRRLFEQKFPDAAKDPGAVLRG